MRLAIAIASIVGFAGMALAADKPSVEQCEGGYKADYSKMWSEADFKKACLDLMMTHDKKN